MLGRTITANYLFAYGSGHKKEIEGEEIGDAFVEHPIPRIISFTGSTQWADILGSCVDGFLNGSRLNWAATTL